MNCKHFFSLILFLILNINQLYNAYSSPEISRRFEYKLSFKGPHLVFKDGTIPFWEHGGSAIPSNDQIRITPSIKSQKGFIWSRNKLTSSDWDIEVLMKINGRGRIGADGMAIWYTEEKGHDGPVFGSNDQWKGLGIFLDSFDNDMQQNNPYILIMTNDGTKLYDHQRDGLSQQIGGCFRDFRNKPFPIRLRIEYYKKALTVLYHSGLNNDPSGYEICARVENVELPKSGHFGVSAATGGLADDHDVLSFITHTLIDKTQPENNPNSEDSKKYDKEYQEFMKQLDIEKERYQKEHPEKNPEIDERKVFEGESDRQFRMILDVQSTIHQSMRSLDAKLAEVLGRQERIVSLLSNNQLAGANTNSNNYNPNAHLQIDTFKRDEVNLVINQQNELVRTVRDLYTLIGDVQRKTNLLQENSAKPSSINAPPSINPGFVQEINDGIKNLRFDFQNAQANTRNQVRCPESPNCLSTFYFMIFIVIQTLLFFVYLIYKSRSEAQMKKFY